MTFIRNRANACGLDSLVVPRWLLELLLVGKPNLDENHCQNDDDELLLLLLLLLLLGLRLLVLVVEVGALFAAAGMRE